MGKNEQVMRLMLAVVLCAVGLLIWESGVATVLAQGTAEQALTDLTTQTNTFSCNVVKYINSAAVKLVGVLGISAGGVMLFMRTKGSWWGPTLGGGGVFLAVPYILKKIMAGTAGCTLT